MKEYILLFLLAFVFVTGALFAQDKEGRCRVYVMVTDARTQKPIRKFPVKILPFNREVKTDKDGRFLLNVPKGRVSLVFDEYNFNRQEIALNLEADTTLTVALTSPFNTQYIEEVEVVAIKLVNDEMASIDRLDKQAFQTLPALMGERDVVKAMSLMSGVSTSSEGSADMQVRGGTHGQNLYLINEVPLYFTQHALGLTSAYNPSVVQSVELFKAAFPARYGGKVSSILAVNTVEPTLTKLNGEAEIGLLSSKAMVNFPIVKDKLGMLVAGRISNFTPFLTLANSFLDKNDTHIGISFSDINAGLKYRVSDRDQLNLNIFHIADNWNIKQEDYSDQTTLLKQNSQQNISVTWNRKQNEKVDNQLMFYADRFISGQTNKTETEIKDQSDVVSEQGFQSSITSLNLTENLSWRLRNSVLLSFGATYQHYFIQPLTFTGTDDAVVGTISFDEGSAFAQSDVDLTDKQKLVVGLRAVAMGEDAAFFNLEPRLSYHIQLPRHYSLGWSLSRMSQPIHRVANPGLGLPMEIFVTSSGNLPPEKSWTTSLGAGKEITIRDFRLSLKSDFWYKRLQGLVEFQDGVDAYTMLTQGYNVYDNDQTVVASGKGTAYGADFSASMNWNKTSLSANYTLMRAVSQFEQLNQGRPFDASTDIRHSLSLIFCQKLAQNLLLSADWQFYSGRPISVPTQVVAKPAVDWECNTVNFSSGTSNDYILIYGERNNYRTRPFHKMDISLTKNIIVSGRYQSSLSFGLYNIYNQANPFVYFVSSKKENGAYSPILKSMSVFPVMPSFSFLVKF